MLWQQQKRELLVLLGCQLQALPDRPKLRIISIPAADMNLWLSGIARFFFCCFGFFMHDFSKAFYRYLDAPGGEIQYFFRSPTVRYWQQWLVPFLDSLVMSSSGPSSPYYGGFLLNSTTRMYNDRFVFHSQPSNKTATILMDFIEVLFEVIYAAKPNTSWETFVSALLNNMGETCQLFFF